MKKIAVISDTHGLLREDVKEKIKEADYVIHAGDITTLEVYEQVKQLKTSYFVRGNNDTAWAKELPNVLTVTIEGITICIVHNKKDLPKELNGIDLVIFGHSHQYLKEQKDQVIYLNPGSCGKRRFHLKLSMAMVTVDETSISIEKISIHTEEKSEN